MSESARKRQKVPTRSGWQEKTLHAHYRAKTFSNSPFPECFSSRLTEAGFAYCNDNDQVLCLFCDLICTQWNVESDDPCEVHHKLAPHCPFVRHMTCRHPWQFDDITPTSPTHTGYLSREKRLASFSPASRRGSLPAAELAEAGFFYNGTNIGCFHCDGSYEMCDRNRPSLAEHVRWFPHCNYARNSCGEGLFHQIVQSTWEKTASVSCHVRQRTSEIDPSRLSDYVDDCVDLPMSDNLIRKKKYARAMVRQCWEEQLQRKHVEFDNECDLHMACEVLKRRTQLHEEGRRKIIPNVELRNLNQARHAAPRTNSNLSYDDISRSFEADRRIYAASRRESCRTFSEDESLTLKREQSLHKWTENGPPPKGMFQNGWSRSTPAENTAQCPHCLVQYSQWKTDDDPRLIHQHLSPLCPFVLASTPLPPHAIPKRRADEHYTSETIRAAGSAPYNGLASVGHSAGCCIADRQLSFQGLPHNSRIDPSELAAYGFYYQDRTRSIRCFYCKRSIWLGNSILSSNQFIKLLHSPSRCRYLQQLNDRDPVPAANRIPPDRCTWCQTEEKRLVALPCRHLCLCEPCAQIKRSCQKCDEDVQLYVVAHLS